MWNAFMVEEATFSEKSDIPFCPCNTSAIPVELISYEDAKTYHSSMMRSGITDYSHKAFIHFYIDDQKFDGKQSSIWLYPENALNIIRHFAGIITPDFSTYVDFPDPWKRFNTYRMRAFGYWIASKGIPVINNVRWGTPETWCYCFDGIPQNSIVCIGTVASGLRQLNNRFLFEVGLNEMVRVLAPKVILVYGSSNYDFLTRLTTAGIRIVSFPSQTNLAFERRKRS